VNPLTSENPKIVMRGAVGIRTDALQAEHLKWLQRRLTVQSVPYKDQPATVVKAFTFKDGRIWFPRYFDHLEFWPKIQAWEWIEPPLNYEFEQRMSLSSACSQIQKGINQRPSLISRMRYAEIQQPSAYFRRVLANALEGVLRS
jgi:hypothetical protein